MFKYLVCAEALHYAVPVRQDEASTVEEACAFYILMMEILGIVPNDWDGFMQVIDKEGNKYEVERQEYEDNSPLYFFEV